MANYTKNCKTCSAYDSLLVTFCYFYATGTSTDITANATANASTDDAENACVDGSDATRHRWTTDTGTDGA